MARPRLTKEEILQRMEAMLSGEDRQAMELDAAGNLSPRVEPPDELQRAQSLALQHALNRAAYAWGQEQPDTHIDVDVAMHGIVNFAGFMLSVLIQDAFDDDPAERDRMITIAVRQFAHLLGHARL